MGLCDFKCSGLVIVLIVLFGFICCCNLLLVLFELFVLFVALGVSSSGFSVDFCLVATLVLIYSCLLVGLGFEFLV